MSTQQVFCWDFQGGNMKTSLSDIEICDRNDRYREAFDLASLAHEVSRRRGVVKRRYSTATQIGLSHASELLNKYAQVVLSKFVKSDQSLILDQLKSLVNIEVMSRSKIMADWAGIKGMLVLDWGDRAAFLTENLEWFYARWTRGSIETRNILYHLPKPNDSGSLLLLTSLVLDDMKAPYQSGDLLTTTPLHAVWTVTSSWERIKLGEIHRMQEKIRSYKHAIQSLNFADAAGFKMSEDD